MHSIDLIILVIASVANLSIGLLSYLKNYRNLTHQLFALLCISLVGWTSANYFSIALSAPESIFVAVRTILVFVVMQNAFFFLFVSAYPDDKVHLKPHLVRAYVAFSTLVLISGLVPGFFSSYAIAGDSISPHPTPFIGLFMLHTVISIGGGFARLLQRYSRSEGIARNRFRFLLFASSVLLLIAPLTNFVLPIIFDFTSLIILSPVYTFVFAAIIAYSMFKHQLLDFRTLVAKAFAYFLSIGLIALMYGGVVFVLFSMVFKSTEVDLKMQLAYILFAVLFGLSFNNLKQFFDKVTNRIFFRDSYDTQVFLNDLNNLLVAQVQLEPLLTGVSQIIERNLKVEYCVFAVRETAYEPVRIIGQGHKKFDQKDILEIRAITPHIHSKVIALDELDESNQELRKVMRESDISVLVRLVSTLNYDLEGVGYIVLGPKKNGNIINSQDIQMLEIVANELVIAVENSLRFEEIEKFNATLQNKVDNATLQLRKTNDKLKQMDETKDEFISMASHQLRTPLTSVKGYLSMVLEGDAGEITPMQQKLLDQAFTSSQRMVYLIADLLNVSRLRTGKFLIEPIATNLADVVESEVHQLSETAKARGLTLTYEKPPNFPTLMLDETKIRQVMMNFMDNAIYYAKPNGTVVVTLEETDKAIEYTVKDDGIGVPKAEQHHLFTKFYRAGNAKKARPDGTGLGLFMAKKVIAAQGGAILFSSQEGKGSTFGFSFDKSKLQPPTVTDTPPQA